jgi:hypothetical protein
MFLAYAFVSERDYRDAELVALKAAAISADRTCWAPEAHCDRAADWRLAANR